MATQCLASQGYRTAGASIAAPISQKGRRSLPVCAVHGALSSRSSEPAVGRRALLGTAALTAVAGASPLLLAADANTLSKQELARRRRKVPESEYTDGPQGIKFYDIEEGGGLEAKVGARVAVHYDIKFRNVTFMTSRVGMGVTGGTPLGFDVGVPAGEPGGTLAGLDVGVRGMRVGGLRRVLVPPELGYGNVQIGEIPPNSTITLDIELLSIKTNPLGFRTKLIEG